ncbi:Mismatch repair protein msh3 [Modicella reniformis]|uniref:DNA mismatch repair protein n=1 Tax=Modicella reniformis TaxID=1440133 RepID=A0A9P6SV28_9FUNG|nr:Mismatch repair protein msh3 [Modicella reniformis]
MVNHKDAPPKVQQTLLSFFKPKTDGTPTTTASGNTLPSLSTSSATSKKRTFNDGPDIDADDNDASGEQPKKKTRTRGGQRTIAKYTAKGVNVDMDESLFPTELADHLNHTLPSSPPSSTALMSIDEHKSQPKCLKKVPIKDISVLSRFEYQVSSMDIDHGDTAVTDAEEQQVKDERRERFLKKLGNLAAPGTSQDAGQQPTAPRRRRLIISESDEEETINEGAIEEVTQDRDEIPDQKGKLPAGRSQKRGATKHQQQQRQQMDKTAAASSELTNAKKTTTTTMTTKSTYTPLEKQFVEIKGQYPDAILCIEVGYKFRFFGEDAQIASRELSIAHFMDHSFYTASIPIHRLDVHVRRLVHAGYKVGVVRQMETAALKSAGDNKSAPFTRKLTNLYTKATFLESLDQDEEQFQGSFVGKGPSSQYLMGIYEQQQGGSGADEKVKIAMLAVQPATGDIIYDEFEDGHFRNELETRLLHIQPAEFIVPMEAMSKATEKLLRHLTASSHRRPGSLGTTHDDVRIERTEGFLKYDKAFKFVSEFYSTSLKEGKSEHGAQGSAKQLQMEALLKTVLGLSRSLIIALSAMISHLTDFGLAPVFRLSKYFECFTSRSHMLLNGNTISNLEIYRNQTDWSTRGSLFAILDHTLTGFGRRLLKKWIGKPLVDRKALQDRVDAVEEILAQSGKNTHLQSAKDMLKGLMDLEKGVCRIHYGKSSPKEFLAILRTFVKVSEAIPSSERSKARPNFGLQSPMLQGLIASLSDASDESRYFLNALHEQAAGKDNKLEMFQDDIIKEKWPEIQEHRDNIAGTESDLLTHLEAIRKLLHEPRLEYSTVSGVDYLIEIKNKDVAKVPKPWVKISGTKQVSRFHTPDAIQLIQSKAQHQERLILACDRAFAAFQYEFSESYEVFRDLVQNLAVLDCLFSLADVASLPGYVKPEYVDDRMDMNPLQQQGLNNGDQMSTDDDDDATGTRNLGNSSSTSRRLTSRVTLDITNGRHPMVEQLLQGNFVPNDVRFSTNTTTGVDEKAIVLTGPNMGGKSCYIRQVALLCIMAQIGSYLPADSARVSLLDAVYTRMGASDNIFGHESTFMVELQETSDILKMATPRSLVILDELGRGTSTLDGVAIAYAVLNHVVYQIGAITLFVTHYPSLADIAQEFPPGTIRNYHMAFIASTTGSGSKAIMDKEVDQATDELDCTSSVNLDNLDDTDIVFLYKLIPGVSMKSYGLNVARMAKLPLSLITKAKIKSKELETILERRVELRRQEWTCGSGSGESTKIQDQLLPFVRKIYACTTDEDSQSLVQSLRTWSVSSL